MISENLDSVLLDTYVEFDTPADQFVGDAELTDRFVDSVHDRLGDSRVPARDLMRRLINLRKMGRLPRLRRNYHGRDVNNN